MKWLSLLVGFLFCANAFAQEKEEDHNVLSLDSFPSVVKAVGVNGYIAGGLEVGQFDSSNVWSQTILEFDTAGNIISRYDYSGGMVINDDTSWYDKSTRTRFFKNRTPDNPTLISMAYNPDGTVNSVFIDHEQQDDVSVKYDYDKQKRVVRRTEVFIDQETIHQFVYAKNGLLMSETILSGLVTEKQRVKQSDQVYVYNSDKERIQMFETFYTDGKIARVRDTVWYKYDGFGCLVEQRESRQNGTTHMYTKYYYDEHNRMQAKVYTYSTAEQPQGDTLSETWEYDGNGFWTSDTDESTDGSGDTFTWSIQYNEKGLPESCTYETEAEVIYYKWTYEYR